MGASAKRKRNGGAAHRTQSGAGTAAGLLAAGRARHRAGDLAGATALYDRALAAEPDNAEALHLAGVARYLAGDVSAAVAFLQRAVALDPGNAETHSNLGASLVATGEMAAAAAAFRRAIELAPGFVDAHANLAGALVRLGDMEGAAAAYLAAHRLAPDVPRFLRRLGEISLDLNRFAPAADWFSRYLAIEPDNAGVCNNAAYACERLGRLAEAEAHYRRALGLRPDSPEIANNLASVLRRLGRVDEARALFAQALTAPAEAWEDEARRAGALCNYGDVDGALALYAGLILRRRTDVALHVDYARALTAAGRFAEAEAVLNRLLATVPNAVEAQIALGECLLRAGGKAEAATVLQKAVAAAPDHLEARLALCSALSGLDRDEEAAECARACAALGGLSAGAFVVLHRAFRAVCAFDDIDRLRVSLPALERDGADAGVLAAGFLHCLVLADDAAATDALVTLHRRWGAARMAEAKVNPLPPPQGHRSGPVRVGILSSDLRSHSVGRFVRPLIDHYDRARIALYCYTPKEAPEDPVQRRIRDRVQGFRVLGGRSHREVAAAIREDGIDILFELNGFTGQSRLEALAWRPAPVQVYWLGYPFTTGLSAVDYILLDADLVPEGGRWLTETPFLMARSWVCYDPFEAVAVPSRPPVARNGLITFGSLNNPYKITRAAVALWARVLNAVPGSRFLYVRPECARAELRRNLTVEFARHGVSADRLSFVNNKAAGLSHFSYYDEIDITLDTMPLTGGTTTADAVWMGVPVVTLAGPALHQRISRAVLRKIGLADLAVETPDAYVAQAVALARDTDRLHHLRAGLRRTLLDSPFCRREDFARDFCDAMEALAARHGLR